MPRKPRFDEPGCFHHVMNRGMARRTVFETRANVRYFLSLLARACRRRRIEVHAYSSCPRGVRRREQLLLIHL